MLIIWRRKTAIVKQTPLIWFGSMFMDGSREIWNPIDLSDYFITNELHICDPNKFITILDLPSAVSNFCNFWSVQIRIFTVVRPRPFFYLEKFQLAYSQHRHHMNWLKICFHLTVKLIEATLLGRNRDVSSATEKTASTSGNASTSGPSSAKECKLVPNQTYQSDLFSNTTRHRHHPKTKAKID